MTRKIKYTRKDLKAPDEFITILGRATLWIKGNRSKVLAAVAVVVLVLGGVFGTRAYHRWEEAKATQDLWPHLNRARELLQTPTLADEEKLARLEQFLAAHVNMHPDTKAAVFAKYYLGSIAYLRGNYGLSAAQFNSALAHTGKRDTLMDFLLREGIAQAYEAGGDAENAQKAYGEAAAYATGELRSQALMGQARTLSLQGRKDEAAAVYRKILADNPDTPMKELIQIKISHLG